MFHVLVAWLAIHECTHVHVVSVLCGGDPALSIAAAIVCGRERAHHLSDDDFSSPFCAICAMCVWVFRPLLSAMCIGTKMRIIADEFALGVRWGWMVEITIIELEPRIAQHAPPIITLRLRLKLLDDFFAFNLKNPVMWMLLRWMFYDEYERNR